MPHQCTNCGQTFGDGSKEMLSGCPGCGGNKFQYRPAGTVDDADLHSGDDPGDTATADGDAVRPDAGDPAPTADATAPTESATATNEREARAESTATPPSTDSEDGAQASARTDVVSEEELAAAAEPSASQPASDEEADAEEPDAVDPNLDALRQKLNDQFESIRIVSPGQYELNLMELYDREEYIISLREDGRYVIEMPEGWDDR